MPGGKMIKQTIILLTAGFLFAVGSTLADDDHLQARRLVEEGVIQPLEKILQQVWVQQPGRILEVELEREQERYIYEIELLDDQGVVWELEIDAQSGEILKTELED
jgi:uncharacterized membrane protein YkoI